MNAAAKSSEDVGYGGKRLDEAVFVEGGGKGGRNFTFNYAGKFRSMRKNVNFFREDSYAVVAFSTKGALNRNRNQLSYRYSTSSEKRPITVV